MARSLRPTDGIRIAGWMRTEFDLKGGELISYALVHCFSQSNAGIYRGGVNYLASWIGCSYNTASKYLKSLVEKNLIIEHPGYENGVPFCNYSINIDVLPQILGDSPSNIGDINRNGKEDIDKDALYQKRTGRFQKPSLEDIRAYCIERNNKVDPDQFFNFYESKGWMVGKNPMTNWRSAIITWEKREKKESRPRPQQRKESAFSQQLRMMDSMYGTNYHQQAYGRKEDCDEQ